MPGEPAPKMKEPLPKLNPAAGRVVNSQPESKKYSYAAYGESRSTNDRDTLAVKEKH